ncbi:hypothetical protein [Paenibacillus campi]|uniref:hypothetical protein n=1 Tax=Paenibacillus campi TaxID=3106031 RepID=UPI002AFEEEF2|nr:hypothetical protein [Paenibacillus sp. SGZ-1009]
MNPAAQLMTELATWIDSVLLRGLRQLHLDDVPALERMVQSADALGMDTLVELLTRQMEHIRQYALHPAEPEQWSDSFFRLAAYIKMARF